MPTALRQRIAMMREKLDRTAPVIEVPAHSQLFVTPDHQCARLVGLAGISDDDLILEPSAGTGAILRAIRARAPNAECEAVELNAGLCQSLRTEFENITVICGDFLQYLTSASEKRYSRIIMNPPFRHGADIKHILHACALLKPRGVLTAVCLNGPRQNDVLKPLSDHWELLPRGTFAYTDVSTVILRIATD